jgi:hypothetical protein
VRNWIQSRAMELFIWWGHKMLGYNAVTLHLNRRTKKYVVGITFGKTR